jgi:hypothetical protein
MSRIRYRLAALVGTIVLAPAFTTAFESDAFAAQAPAPTVANIPVIVYHQLNNGCAATAPTCSPSYPESVSTRQMTAQLRWLHNLGYQSVNLTQYLDWLHGDTRGLPAKPVLITFDNGIDNLQAGAVPILQKFHYTAVSFLVTGFTDGAPATGFTCNGTPIASDPTVNTELGCPSADQYWDSTWSQLQALAKTGVYQFSIEAGPSGHYVQTYNPECSGESSCADPGLTDNTNCYEFYACEDVNSTPPETDAQYEGRVQQDLNTGKAEIEQYLASYANLNGWVVPYGDIGDPCGDVTNPLPCGLPYNGPMNADGYSWLEDYAASQFQAVFVETPGLNGHDNERYRYDCAGGVTQAQFEQAFKSYVSAGDFKG